MKNKQYILSILLLFTIVGIAQDVKFTGKASKTKIALNQKFRIEYTVNSDKASEFVKPDLNDFKIAGGPFVSRESGYSSSSGSYNKATISYLLIPKAKGTFTIPPASIQVSGKTIKSNAITVTILEKVTEKEESDDYIENNIFLVTSVSKTSPYVGESLLVEYRLYYNVRFYNASIGELPKYPGFWSQEIETEQTEEKKEYKGKMYHYLTVKKAVLTPQKSGKLIIEPLRLEADIKVPTNQRNFWGTVMKNVKKTISSSRRTITVKSLPTSGKPHDFTGAVGDFSLRVKASKNTLKANESTQVKIAVTGKGNFKLFEIPKIKTPTELEVYTPEHKESLRTTASGLKGGITDDYAIVPSYKGKFIIPATSFSYFSLKDEKYKTLISEAIVIDVTEGKELPSTAVDSENTAQQIVKNTGKDFRYIHTKVALESVEKSDFFGSTLFYVLLLFPFLLLPLGLIFGKKYKKKQADVGGNKIRKANKLAKKYLSEAKKLIGEKEAFYLALEKALHNFLKAKLHLETSELSQDRIVQILTEKQVTTETSDMLKTVLNNCDFARYAPASGDAMQSDYDKASNVLNKINTEIQ